MGFGSPHLQAKGGATHMANPAPVLNALASDGQWGEVARRLSTLSPDQYEALNSAYLEFLLEEAAAYSSVNPSVSAEAVGRMVVVLGSRLSGEVTGRVLETLSASGNLRAVEKVVCRIRESLKAEIPGERLDATLLNLAVYSQTDTLASATAVTVFVIQMGAHVSGHGFGQALDALSGYGNFDGVRGLTDYMARKDIPAFSLDNSMLNLVNFSQVDKKAATRAVRDFSRKLSRLMTGAGLYQARQVLSGFGDLAGARACGGSFA